MRPSILQHDMAWHLTCFHMFLWVLVTDPINISERMAGYVSSWTTVRVATWLAKSRMQGRRCEGVYIFGGIVGGRIFVSGRLRRSFRRIRLYDGLLRPPRLWCLECFWFGTVARPSLPSNTSMIFTSFIEIWSLEISSCPKVVWYSARHSLAFWDSRILIPWPRKHQDGWLWYRKGYGTNLRSNEMANIF